MIKLTKILAICFVLCLTSNVFAGWTKQTTNSLAWFRTIDFVNQSIGRIGGSDGTYLVTVDGGKNWRPGRKFTSDSIRRIHFTDVQNGWALCERDVYSLGEKVPAYLMRTENGGETWKRVDFAGSDRRRVVNIAFTADGRGFAMGEMGALYGLDEDKRSWKLQLAPSAYLMLDAAFADDSIGAIVGGGGTIMFTEDAGSSWNKATVSGNANRLLRTVTFINRRDGWTAGAGGKIFQTINGGKSWRLQSSGTKTVLNDLYFKNNAIGWAIGNDGVILQTTTGGNVWSKVRSESTHHLEDIEFAGNTGWIVGFGGTLLKWETGGLSTRPRLKQR